MSSRQPLYRWLWAIWPLFLGWSAHADVYVIGQANAPVVSLSKTQVADLYMGRVRSLPSGDFALLFEQPRDSEARQRFFKAYTGMPINQVNAYWSRLMFTGQTQAPLQLPDERAVLEIVKRNPSAIGYVLTKPTDASIRVLSLLPE